MRPDERIEDLIKKHRHKTAAETDERILLDASAALEEVIGEKRGGFRVKVSTVVGLGAAAILLIATLILVSYLYQSAEVIKEQEQVGRFVETEQAAELKPEREVETGRKERLFESDLQSAKKLFEDGDEDGLIMLLSQGITEKQLAAVLYLARLGDARTIEKLDALSERFGRDRSDNMFKIAIAAIENQLDKSRKAIEPIKSVDKADETKTAAERRFITGWVVEPGGKTVQGRIWYGKENVVTSESGEFKIPLNAVFAEENRRLFSNLLLAHNREQSLWSVLALDESGDFNDFELMVGEPASVSGYIVDRYKNPAEDFELTVRIPFDGNDLSRPLFDVTDVWTYHKSETRAWRTVVNPDGSFRIDTVPVGVKLWMVVEKPGFKTVVSLLGLQPGRNLDMGEIVLEPLEGFDEKTRWDYRLWGLVVDEAGMPVSGARLFARVGEEKIESRSDAGGLYEFEGLAGDANMTLDLFSERFGETVFYHRCTDVNERLDIQVFPAAYDWYGKQAPGIFVAKWLNCEPLSLEQLRGDVVVLCVGWDSVGQPDIIDEVADIYEVYKDEPVTVIAIHKNLPQGRGDEQALIRYIEEKGIEFPCVIDGDVNDIKDLVLPQQKYVRAGRIGLRPGYQGSGFSPGATYSLYEVSVRLRYYIIDKNGILRASPEFKDVNNWIERLLAE